MIDKSILDVMFLEIHKSINETTDNFIAQLRQPTPAYPPGVALTQEEQEELKNVALSADAVSGLRKLVADACSYPLMHLFSLMDGVADPENYHNGHWQGISLVVRPEEDAAMLHDELFESYWQYQGRKTS